ncbi:MAG: DUF2852 domain-containing protein [Roseinatronobacter sp.]|nr:DUF2852 domain-containing protein [Roseinatronobacter sp.]
MNTANPPLSWGRQAEAWLDGYGKTSWIAAMVLAFIVFWPLGLAILAYLIWGKKMFGKSCRNSLQRGAMAAQSSGNSAFDAYKADTLRRLEEEQTAFSDFLKRLRDAKDKAEFDAFMEDNRKRRDTGTDTPAPTT